MIATVKRAPPLYRQIVSQLEERILTGELVAGERLPTTQELARGYGVTVQTMQQAAALLAKRGLIERTPRHGSFVSNRVHSRTLGIVFGSNVFGDPHMLFFQRLYGLICRELKRLHWHVSLYFPPEEQAPEQWLAEVGQDVERGKLRGLISLCSSAQVDEWLAEHPSIPQGRLPISEVGSGDPQLDDAYRGVDYLLGRGYRRLAVVLHTETSPPAYIAQTKARIAAAYAQHQVPLQAAVYEGHAASLATGVAQARTVLAAPGGPPEAFLVLNDMGCSGVIFELLCRRLQIPADIAVMGATNKGIEIPCPVPLTCLERDSSDYARQAIEGVLAQIEGRPPVWQPVVSTLVVGASCGE